MGLFKEVPITFIAMISFFSILGQNDNNNNNTNNNIIVYSFHLFKYALSNCVLLLFRGIFLCYLASISHVSLCKYELGFKPN